METDKMGELGLVQNMPIVIPMVQVTEEMFYLIRSPMAWQVHYEDGTGFNSSDADAKHWLSVRRTGIVSIEFVMDNTGRRETLRGKWFGRRDQLGMGAEYVSVSEDLPFGEVDRLWGGCIWHKGA